MLRYVLFFAVAVVLGAGAPNPYTNVFEIDISPEEAQKYLNSPPFTAPQLSRAIEERPLVKYNSPQFRSDNAGPTLGHYWRNGHEIENTDDFNEQVYDASQFHGQDGLGAFAYGYQAPESSKVENRARSGDVTGSYEYKSGDNDVIKVRYWADSQGFHQEDNIPKVELQPVQESEEVRQARVAHEKAWNEAAQAAAQQPDPQGAYYADQPSGSASEIQSSFLSAPGQDVARAGKAYGAQQNYQRPQAFQPQPSYQQASYQGNQPSYQNQQYQASQKYQSSQQAYPSSPQTVLNYDAQGSQGKYEEPEPTGPPRGFFYSFNYPVSIIVPKDPAKQAKIDAEINAQQYAKSH